MAKRRDRDTGGLWWSEAEQTWVGEVVFPDGKRKKKRNKRKSVVRNWIEEQKQAIKDGTMVMDERVTFSQLIDRYMKDVAPKKLRPKTLESYNSLLRTHIRPGLGSVRVSQLRAEQLDAFYTQKLESGLSNRTVQYIHTIIHVMLDQAMKWRLVVRNESDLVTKPKVKRSPPSTWSLEEVNRFLEAVRGHRFYPIYLLAIASGAREGELLGIYFEDINWETGTLNIKRAVQYLIGKGVVLSELKSSSAKRPIPLPDYALKVLKEHCDQQKRNQGFIFVTSNMTPFSPRNLVRHFKEVIKELGLPDIRFHDIRHYHASYLLSQGVNPKVVQERLGHSQISLTMDTYSHTIPSLQAEAARKVNDIFEPSVKPSITR